MNQRVFTISVILILVLTLSVTILIAVPAPGSKLFVSNSNDSGPGSFREAINRANFDPAITRIQFLGGVATISLQQTVWFNGSQDLTIDGNGATLNGADAGGPAFRTTGGGDLDVSNLTVRNSPAEGIAVEVPIDATGTIHLSLFKVDIIENKGHGLLLNDQQDPTTQEGIQPNPNGSDASIDVSIVNSRFIGNGYSESDRDGLRVNEGGDGDLFISIKHTLSQDNAADGIEVDERGDGNVRVDMFGSQVIGNGKFDPADLEDGFDIDEWNEGSIVGLIFLSSATNNYEEGFDFNENNAGDLRVDMQHVEANGNREEGIDYEEDDDFAGGGDLVTTLAHVKANQNGTDDGDAGLKIREKGVGNLAAALNGVETSNNLIGGISIREDAVGNLFSSIIKAISQANTGHGIDFDENSGGDLTGTVAHSISSANGGAGIRADQQTPGVGTLQLSNVTLDGNTGGPTTGANVTVTNVQ